jgi:hypothetical protein
MVVSGLDEQVGAGLTDLVERAAQRLVRSQREDGSWVSADGGTLGDGSPHAWGVFVDTCFAVLALSGSGSGSGS